MREPAQKKKKKKKKYKERVAIAVCGHQTTLNRLRRRGLSWRKLKLIRWHPLGANQVARMAHVGGLKATHARSVPSDRPQVIYGKDPR